MGKNTTKQCLRVEREGERVYPLQTQSLERLQERTTVVDKKVVLPRIRGKTPKSRKTLLVHRQNPVLERHLPWMDSLRHIYAQGPRRNATPLSIQNNGIDVV